MATVTSAEPVLDDRQADTCYEVVKGQIVEWPPMSFLANRVKSEMHQFLAAFARTNELGYADVEMLFLIDQEDDNARRPDVSFVSYERWPRTRRITNEAAWNVVPDLAVEIVSSTDRGEDIVAKVAEYFHAGVRAVWVVYPVLRLAYLYHSFTTIQVIDRDGEIDGGEILPGFRLSMTTLFEGLPQ